MGNRGCHCHEVPFVVFPVQQPVLPYALIVIARSIGQLKPDFPIFLGMSPSFLP